MAVDVEFAERQFADDKLKPYFGFDPETEYVIRARNRDYKDTSEQYYRFSGGECISGRMRPDATEQQKWDRGERLSKFVTRRGVTVYERGTEPPRAEEPLWAHLPPDVLDTSGEEPGGGSWRAAPKTDPTTRMVDGTLINPGQSGEAQPSVPRVVTTV